MEVTCQINEIEGPSNGKQRGVWCLFLHPRIHTYVFMFTVVTVAYAAADQYEIKKYYKFIFDQLE